MMINKNKFSLIILLCLLTLGACLPENTTNDDLSHSHNDVAQNEIVSRIKNNFSEASLLQTPAIVNCTLSGGAKTQCISLTFSTTPKDYKTGPWCPRNIKDGADKGGIWLDDGKIYDVDGKFISNVDQFYDDDFWKMYDSETGDINVTDTKEECAAAARPDVDPKYYNHCVECQPSYMDEDASATYVIPLNPVRATRQSKARGGVGVSLSGVKLDSSAPVNAILDAHTLAPFDDCGGHVNLHVGYHIHAERGCGKQISVEDEHAAMIGYAMDGYPIHAQKDKVGQEPSDLDSCRGHNIQEIGYHYHAADPAKNETLPCLTGQSGCSLDDRDTECNAMNADRRGPPPRR